MPHLNRRKIKRQPPAPRIRERTDEELERLAEEVLWRILDRIPEPDWTVED